MTAPVSVAMSTIASAPSSTASESPSARTSRPSASVLWISTVLPLRIFSTSPSFIALPEGMLSVQHRKPTTLTFGLSTGSSDIVASTTAAPVMSIFISTCMPSEGFSEMPPESYMTPLPTSATVPTGWRGV